MTTKITNLNIDTTTITSIGNLTSLTVTGNIDSGNVSGTFVSGDGSKLTQLTGANVTGYVANATVANTVRTNAQPNITSVGTLSSLTVSGSTTLGSVANVHISGGFANWVLSTDGSGSLSWAPQATGGGGNSNVAIVPGVSVSSFTASGSSNSFTLTTTPASKAQTMVHLNGVYQVQSVYNLVGNVISFTANPPSGTKVEVQVITSGTIANTVNDGAQPNITSIGILSNLAVSGNVTFQGANISLGSVGNVKVTGGTTGQTIITDGSGNLSFSTITIPDPLHPFLLGGM